MESENNRTKIEILHFGKFDLLVNRLQSSISEKELEALKNTVAEDLKDSQNGNLLISWKQGEDYRVRVDDRASPSFVIKQKWIRPENYDFGKEEELENSSLSSDLEFRKMIYASASIMNEMSLATSIRKIVGSKEVQEIFRNSGVTSIDYIEPLIGIINKETGEKNIIYKYAEGISLKKHLLKNPDLLKRMFSTIRRLEVIITDKNIIPHDLQSNQFLAEIDADGRMALHLLDIDLFTKA